MGTLARIARRLLGRDAGVDARPGSRNYRAFVGPPERYDLVAALQFNLLTFLGLREDHYLLDIGCGSLRGGRLFIPYLLPRRYHGIEPERWLLRAGIRKEVGKDLVRLKRPAFRAGRDFDLGAFGVRFDFLLAQSIFSHASRRQIAKCLSEAKKVMKPEAFFAATYVRGEADHEGDGWVYPACVRYTLDTMAVLGEESGLACRPIDWPHPKQQWLVFVHPGREDEIDRRREAIRGFAAGYAL